MSKFRLLAAAALVMGFLAVESASCTILKDTFSVTVKDGPWAGTTPEGGSTPKTYTGSFTWNTKIQGVLDSFTTDLPIWDPQDPTNPGDPTDLSKLGLVYLANPIDASQGWAPAKIYLKPLSGDGINYFILSGIGPESGTLVYGIYGETPFIVHGVIYIDPPVETPEPGTLALVAFGIAGTLGMAWRRRVA